MSPLALFVIYGIHRPRGKTACSVYRANDKRQVWLLNSLKQAAARSISSYTVALVCIPVIIAGVDNYVTDVKSAVWQCFSDSILICV